MRRFLIVLLVMVMIPYVTTLAWTGKVMPEVSSEIGAVEGDPEDAEERVVIIEREEKKEAVSVEAFLVSVLAAQIPADFEMETLKAQTILARTYIYGVMNGRSEIYEEELDMDAFSSEQMRQYWGEEDYAMKREKMQSAVQDTAGLYLLHDGITIEPLFCYASAGKTRTLGEEHPYLISVDSPGDCLAEAYRTMPVFQGKEFVKRINEISPETQLNLEDVLNSEGIQVVERDAAGYVKQIQIGKKTYQGESVQYALGLPSACYSLEVIEDKIRAICRGIGHGFGFAQYGANEMAKEGKTYEELLNHYFQNIEIVAWN